MGRFHLVAQVRLGNKKFLKPHQKIQKSGKHITKSPKSPVNNQTYFNMMFSQNQPATQIQSLKFMILCK